MGLNGYAAKSIDGGRNWTKSSTPTSEVLNDVLFLDRLRGYAVGDSGVLLYTNDGGGSWKRAETETKMRLERIAAANGTVFIVGFGGIMLKGDAFSGLE